MLLRDHNQASGMLGINKGIWNLVAVLCLLSGRLKGSNNLPHKDLNHLGLREVARMVKCLPSMYEALVQSPVLQKTGTTAQAWEVEAGGSRSHSTT